MGQFNTANYEILTPNGKHLWAALFNSAGELFDFVRNQAVGTYGVFVEGHRERGEPASKLWGYVTLYGAGTISYHLTLPGA